jgi:hypothetical protein
VSHETLPFRHIGRAGPLTTPHYFATPHMTEGSAKAVENLFGAHYERGAGERAFRQRCQSSTALLMPRQPRQAGADVSQLSACQRQRIMVLYKMITMLPTGDLQHSIPSYSSAGRCSHRSRRSNKRPSDCCRGLRASRTPEASRSARTSCRVLVGQEVGAVGRTGSRRTRSGRRFRGCISGRRGSCDEPLEQPVWDVLAGSSDAATNGPTTRSVPCR